MTPARLLVMGAGSAGAENLIRSLRGADASLALLGCNDDRFVIRRSAADSCHLVPPPGSPGFVSTLCGLMRESRVDLVIPTIDRHVQALSDARADFGGRVFLPAARVIALCRDKYRLTTALRRRGVPAPATYPVRGPDGVDGIFARLGRPGRVWCRPRTGTCARGGAAVSTPDEARRWMALWETMQGVPVSAFTLAEYLPGREILCQSVWQRGRMMLANTFERLAYFGADNIPSGVTSLSSLAKTVVEPGVVEVCRAAIAAVAPGASGAFSVDVKEDAGGRPHVTEINAGRFFMAMTAFDRVLKHNIALTYVRLALGERVDLGETYDAIDDYYMVRDMDIEPGVFHADEFFDDMHEARGAAKLTVRPLGPARS
jgi:predicted ATP-grasp superfamily ATP-dependent carboligase